MKLEDKHMNLFKEIQKVLQEHGKIEKVMFDGKFKEDLIDAKDAFCMCDIYDCLVKFWENEND